MAREKILEGLKNAIVDIDDEKIMSLLKQGVKEGLPPLDMIVGGLNVGLTDLGEGFAKAERFMSEVMIAGQIMTDAVELLRPELEKGGKSTGDVMIIGTVEGDLHTIGKRIVSALFIGAGYTVVDIGEDVSAPVWVKAVKEHKAIVVGASAILQGVKPYCKVISNALEDAGLRDKVIFIAGGWGMTQAWCDDVEADCFGVDALDALHKIKAIRSGEVKRFKDRKKK